MVQATVSGTFGTALKAHASVHANGDIGVMMTNTNRNIDANVTLNFTGGTASPAWASATPTRRSTRSGRRSRLRADLRGRDGVSVSVAVPQLSSVVVVFPKK